MELTGTQIAAQQQKLILGTEQRQSLEILRMQITDLREAVIAAVTDNPLLAMEEDEEPLEVEFSPVALDENDEAGEGRDEEDVDDFDAEEYENCSREETFSEPKGTGEVDIEAFSDDSTEEKFLDVLLEQLIGLNLAPEFEGVCRYILESLNDRGYLDDSVEELALELGLPVFDVMQALYVVQTFTPLGVGARTLSECLMLQLVASEDFGAHTIKLVKDGLELLAKNDIKAISTLLECDMQAAQEACEVVRSLNPIPSCGYKTSGVGGYIIPDAMVRYEDGQFIIKMNDHMIPRISLHNDYCQLLQKSGDATSDAYLKAKLPEAKTFIKSLESRYDTLYHLIACIVELQQGFFLNNQPLVPMSLEHIASKLGLHPSTVSRAVQGKYIVYVGGTVSLKSLFTKGIVNEDGDIVPVERIKEKIRLFINAENSKAPLSDEDISMALKALNMKISRRTVAKYREELGVEASSKRKQK